MLLSVRWIHAGVFFQALHDAAKVKVMELLAEKLAGHSPAGSRGATPLLDRRDQSASGAAEGSGALQPLLVGALVAMAKDYHAHHLLPSARPVRLRASSLLLLLLSSPIDLIRGVAAQVILFTV